MSVRPEALLELLRVRCPISTGVVKLVRSRSGLLKAAMRDSFPYNKASAEESKASGGEKNRKKKKKKTRSLNPGDII